MGKIVKLPQNGDRHYQLGETAYRSKNYASAAAHLEKAFALTPGFDAARMLVKSYVELKTPEQTVPFLSQFMEDFLASEADTALLFAALLAMPDYRFAWAVWQHVGTALQPRFKAQIEAAEAADQAAHAPQIDDVARQLRHLGGFAPKAQEQLLTQLGRLPKAALIAAAGANLADPDVHPAVRISLLDALTAVGSEEPVVVQGYQGQGAVIPKALPSVMSDPTLLRVLGAVQTQIGLADPELMQATVDTLRFELGYLYPFIDQVVVDPKHFAASYLHQEAETVTPEERAVFSWLQAQTAKLMDMA